MMRAMTVLAVGFAATACSEPAASQTSEVAAAPQAAPAQDSGGGPLWQVQLEYGQLTAINRPPSVSTPREPVDAELWIISDMMGQYDALRIALSVDCAAHSYAFQTITTYAGSELLESNPARDTAPTIAQPDTPYSAMMSHVCDPHGPASASPEFEDFTAAQAAVLG